MKNVREADNCGFYDGTREKKKKFRDGTLDASRTLGGTKTRDLSLEHIVSLSIAYLFGYRQRKRRVKTPEQDNETVIEFASEENADSLSVSL